MKNIYIGAGIVVFLSAAAFAYYAISPVFRVVRVDDAVPVMAATEVIPVSAAPEQKGAEVMGTPGHPASGMVRIVSADGKQYVRYENFKTINGPDIFVYLSKDMGAKEFINLGEVKGTEGNINYEIPAGVDVSQYPYVLTWCKQFSVLFNYAKIN